MHLRTDVFSVRIATMELKVLVRDGNVYADFDDGDAIADDDDDYEMQ